MEAPVLTIIIPCYNEEEILPYTFQQLTNMLKEMIEEELVSNESKLLFVDDGSNDQTWRFIFKESLRNRFVRGLKLAKNSGHQNALLAGMIAAKRKSDCIITIDADLQDDISAMKEFIRKYQEGNEIVYGVRTNRKTDSLFKRKTAEWFYKLMGLIGVELVFNHADFRLMSRRAVEALEQFKEANLFLRGIIPLIGFQSCTVEYSRKERMAGETKYPLRKMLSFAFDGITSFSVMPIRAVTFAGFASFVLSALFALYFLSLKFLGETELGWTSIILSIWLIGGLQLIAIGLVGEYVGKIYKEVKRRPKFIIDIDTFNMPLILEKEGEGISTDIHNARKIIETT